MNADYPDVKYKTEKDRVQGTGFGEILDFGFRISDFGLDEKRSNILVVCHQSTARSRQEADNGTNEL